MLQHWKKLLLALPLLAGGWIAYQLAPISTPIVVSNETTHLTEPLAEDGLPDYSGALLAELRKGVTPENNGGIQYLQAMWPAELMPEHQQVVCDELGMAMPESDGMVSPESSMPLREELSVWLRAGADPDEDWEAAEQAASDAERLLSLLNRQPWKPEEAPQAADYIDRHDAQFQLLHEALAKEHSYIPSPSLLVDPNETWLAMDMTISQSMRDATRCLAARAHLRIGEGDLAGAWQDCHAIYAASDRLDTSLVIDQLISVAIEGVASRVSRYLLAHSELNASQAGKVLAFYKQRPPRSGMVRAIDTGDRHVFLTHLFTYGRLRGSDAPTQDGVDFRLSPLVAERIDWNTVLRIANEGYDEVVRAGSHESWADRHKAISEWSQAINQRSQEFAPTPRLVPSALGRATRSDTIGQMLLLLQMPALEAVFPSEDRRNAERQLMPIAAALTVYHCNHGGYPDSLAALTPRLLPESPTDLYHDAPFVYRKTDRGYLLYSLGPNNQDDGGSNNVNSVYQGYRVDNSVEGQEAAVLRALGEPVDEEADDPVRFDSLRDQIPAGADDHAIRMPPFVVPLPGHSAP